MWKWRRAWITLALLILLNPVAWDVRTVPQDHGGFITLYQHQANEGSEYTTLRPARFYLDSIWYSYAVALFVGAGLPFLLPRFLPWSWRRRHSLVPYLAKAAPFAVWLGRHGIDAFFAFLKFVLLIMAGLVGALRLSARLWGVLALLIVFNVLAWDWIKPITDNDLGIRPGVVVGDTWVSVLASLFVGEIIPLILAVALFRRRQLPDIPPAPVPGAPR